MRNHLIITISIIALAIFSTGATAFANPMTSGVTISVSQRHNSYGRPGSPLPSRPGISKEKQRLLKKADACRHKAADYRRQAQIHLDKAKTYRHQADNYLHHHQYANAKSAQKKADNEMRKYDQLTRKATEQERKAKEYERQASHIR